MASIINAATSGGLVTTADTSGVLQLQTASTTAVTVSAAQIVSTTNGMSIQGLTVGLGAGAVSTNTVVGVTALASNTTGFSNIAVGYQAGYINSTGAKNVFIGRQAGYVSTGNYNTIVGNEAGLALSTGTHNTFVGGYNNTVGGAGETITTGSKNTILGIYTGNNDSLDIRTASNYVVLSDGDGNRQITMKEGFTLALDSAVPNAGTGITFPATQSASSDANTLDDYEEGTWAYDFTATTGTITKSATFVNGFYTKVGRVVTITGFLQVLSVSSPTGSLTLTGLPFPIGSTGARENYVGGGIFGTILATGSVSPLMINGQNGHSYLTISKFVAGSSADLAGDVIADTRFYISFSYFV